MEELKNVNPDEEAVEEEAPKFTISHIVSANRLKVYVRINLNDKDAKVKSEDILNYLSEQGITYGIKESEIQEYCDNGNYVKELVAACGLDPVDGKNAEIVYHFDTSQEKKFTEKEDGSIDFLNLNNVINVTKNTLLCHIVPAAPGKNGIDVLGNDVSYRPGKSISFNNGNNTFITEDGLQLKASVDGCVKMAGSKVIVENVYRVDNVDNETGNIDILGDLVVNGDVKSGFSVKAKGDIKIRGMVEGAYIEGGKDIVISKGVNGMGKGTIDAAGDITSKYIENANVKSRKNVYAEVLINSDVAADESVILRGQNAAILGGVTKAKDKIYAKTIGSKVNAETNLIIDLSEYEEELDKYNKKKKENQKLRSKLAAKNGELKDIEEKINIISGTHADVGNRNLIYKNLILRRAKVNSEINDIEETLKKNVPPHNIVEHKIICKGVIYSNTRLAVGWLKYRIRQDTSYSKIYNDGSDIVIMPLNPSDLE